LLLLEGVRLLRLLQLARQPRHHPLQPRAVLLLGQHSRI
jgi:hypothetical protein